MRWYPKTLANTARLHILEFVSKFFWRKNKKIQEKENPTMKVKTNVKAGRSVWNL